MVQDTKVEDMRLPPVVVSKIVDKAIGPTGTVSKEARTAIGRAASVSFIRSLFLQSLLSWCISFRYANITCLDIYSPNEFTCL